MKVLRFHHGLDADVAEMLRQPIENPPPLQEKVDPDETAPSGTLIASNRRQSALDIFPSLEEIIVYTSTPETSVDAKERASVLELFGPFVTVRHQMGHSVNVFWITNGEVPWYFMIDSEFFSLK